jgi:hypothetical protein
MTDRRGVPKFEMDLITLSLETRRGGVCGTNSLDGPSKPKNPAYYTPFKTRLLHGSQKAASGR